MFYSKPNGDLVYLKSQTEEEASVDKTNVPLYKRENVVVSGETVSANTKSPQIAAISYTLHGKNEVLANLSDGVLSRPAAKRL